MPVGFQVPGDLELTEDGRSFVVTSGARLAKQSITSGSQVWRGYWFYDDSRGLPMLESVLIKNADLRVVTQVFRTWLGERAGVTSVKSCTVALDRVTRQLAVRFSVACEDGSTLSDELAVAVG